MRTSVVLFWLAFLCLSHKTFAGVISTKLEAVEFQETPLSEAIEFLRGKSQQVDPTGRGLNFLINPDVDQDQEVTLHLSDVSIGATLICIVDYAGVDYRVDSHACLVLPPGQGELAKVVPRNPQSTREFNSAKKARGFHFESVDFAEAPIRDVVKYIAQKFKRDHPEEDSLNLVLSGLIDPELPVTLKLNNVSSAEVLRYIAETTAIEIRVEPYAIFLDPPGTRMLQLARIEAMKPKSKGVKNSRPAGRRSSLWGTTDDPRSPAHPDYVRSTHPRVEKRTNSLNNVYKWVGGKWTFVRYGSGDLRPSSLDTP